MQLSSPAQLFEEKSFLLTTPLLYQQRCQHYVREPKVVAEAPGVVLVSTQVSFLPEVFAVGKSDKKMKIEGRAVKGETLPRS